MNGYIVKELLHYCNISVSKCMSIEEFVIDFYDFTFMLEGGMEYVADGKKIIIGKNDALFLPPGTLRRRFAGNTPVKYVSFNFIADDNIKFNFDTLLKGAVNHTIKELPSMYPYTHLTDGHYAKEKCSNMLNYILLELMDNYKESSKNCHIKRILQYIDANITSDIDFDSICKFAGLSREYTCSLFKRETGFTITDYINNSRMKMAKELIIGRQMCLKDVAEFVGYNNYNYFSRLFKKTYGNTPNRIKK